MSDVLSYDHCSLVELYQVLNSIDAETYRDNFEALDAEIRSRQGASHAELLKCWVMLKKGRWPDYEAYLAAQIETARRREGISYDEPPPTLEVSDVLASRSCSYSRLGDIHNRIRHRGSGHRQGRARG